MGEFREWTEGGNARVGFVYADSDGDGFAVWHWLNDPDKQVRLQMVGSARSVDIDGSQIGELKEKIEDLLKDPCPNCNGSGKV